jgi:hypothetical protein
MLRPDELNKEDRAEIYASLLKSHSHILKMAEFKGLTKKQAEGYRKLAAAKLLEAEQYRD